ncbi:MAG: GNAT family N-acetyltransferase [Ignavibacteria bacterium]|nr:GNAT family N-acetyltransferase [Ignavibacteria bacterium]MBI3764958.1 GNAT family N-acetyltransferase [Ignavibacteriales bacterium]
MLDALSLRNARSSDVPLMLALMFEHGPNPWNYLPREETTAHLQAVGGGAVFAVVAQEREEIVGLVTFCVTTHFARYQPAERSNAPHGYVCEAVVHRDHSGKGLGTRLLMQALEQLASLGMKEVYIDRHEENARSAGMMRKAGFVEVDVFYDPKRRVFGSKRTAVCQAILGT